METISTETSVNGVEDLVPVVSITFGRNLALFAIRSCDNGVPINHNSTIRREGSDFTILSLIQQGPFCPIVSCKPNGFVVILKNRILMCFQLLELRPAEAAMRPTEAAKRPAVAAMRPAEAALRPAEAHR